MFEYDGRMSSTTHPDTVTADAVRSAVGAAVETLRAYAVESHGPSQHHEHSDVDLVDLLGQVEDLVAAATAAQARAAVDLTTLRHGEGGARATRRVSGVAHEVAAARRVSPHRGRVLTSAARIWADEMPHTHRALAHGILNETRALLLVRETATLPRAHRTLIDRSLCADPHARGGAAGLGERELTNRIQQLAYTLDPAGACARHERAARERHVSVRPVPGVGTEGMARLSALLPLADAVATLASLRAGATTLIATGHADGRTRSQVEADLLVARLTQHTDGVARAANDDPCADADAHTSTGTGTGGGGGVALTLDLVMAAETLLAPHTPAGNHAAVLHGPRVPGVVLPAQTARFLAAGAIDTDTAWVRLLFRDHHGDLVHATSRHRFAPTGLADLLRNTQHGICATPWCDAPVAHTDHLTAATDDGATTLANLQGLCEDCNHAKEMLRRTGATHHRPPGSRTTHITMPTGHTHTTRPPVAPGHAPTPPGDGQTGRRRDHRGSPPRPDVWHQRVDRPRTSVGAYRRAA